MTLGLVGREAPAEEARAAFLQAVCDTLDAVEIPVSIADLGIAEDEFRARLPELVEWAFEDLSGRTNPRQPMVAEIEQLFEDAWKGR